MKVIITGGAGFIGSAVVRRLVSQQQYTVLNLDKLTYAGNLTSLKTVSDSPNYQFVKMDICDRAGLRSIFEKFRPDAVMHLAAESHVDRSIDGAAAFIETNIGGTYTLLEASLEYWRQLPPARSHAFRFHHVSTDEVYGDLGAEHAPFDESHRYAPSSPYSASKASADHLVRAWCRTFGLPILVSNCSNNYGPYHFPEKLIPHVILNALGGQSLPVYGDGSQVRDWLYVEDHAAALERVLTIGKVGDTYNIGGKNEVRNIEVVHRICDLLEELTPQKPAQVRRYEDLITFVEDRPGHDVRYAINAAKIERELGWRPKESFESGLRKTVEWFLLNEAWWREILERNYKAERKGKLMSADVKI